MNKLFIVMLVALVVIFCDVLSAQEFDLDVPFVPTNYEVVEEMLKIANVGKNDILYDLGCGDGRIVVTAAKKYGARGIGYDIDPTRIAESWENAKKENVTDRVQFIEQDLFEADFSKATVVTMYLLSSVNLQMRPKLFQQLKPGTRIVSHDFNMGDWMPDKETQVGGNEYYGHSVYFWIIPANVTGDWSWNVTTGSRNKQYILNIDQHFQKLDGLITSGSNQLSPENLIITSDLLQFSLEENVNGKKTSMNFTGRVNGNIIEGTIERTGVTPGTIKWQARRDPETVKPLDTGERLY
jgi:SAM-dependent methyltransferase